jgi:hypothetical protein
VKDTITGATIVWRGTASSLIDLTQGAASVTLAGQVFTLTPNPDGSVTITGVEGAGGSSLAGTVIAVFTANGYNSVDYAYQSGADFQIGGFGATTLTNNPVTFAVPVQVVDGDGDVSTSSNLNVTLNPVPPVVIDLDGDGVEFLSLAAGVTYDYGDGLMGTAWAGHDDGILAIDSNRDGQVSSASEFVFGGNGLTDLEGIAAHYDSNHDGVLDAQDAAFAQFGVWQDADSNGVADAGEFRTLGELGITAIKLTSDGAAYVAAGGDVKVAGTTTVTYVDGSTSTAADASFAIERLSQEVGNAVTAATAGSLVTAAAAAIVIADSAAAETTPSSANSDPAPSVAAVDQTSASGESVQDSNLLADTSEDKVQQAPAHEGQHGSDDAGHAAALAEAVPDHTAVPDAGADSDDGASHFAAAILFDSPAAAQAMDGLLIAVAQPSHAPAQGAPSVADAVAPLIEQVLTDAHAATFVDSLIDSIAGQHGALAGGEAPQSVDLAALLSAEISAGVLAAAPQPPAVFTFDHAAAELQAASHA